MPLPEPEVALTANGAAEPQSTASSFHHLCALTGILGDILPLVYSLKPNYKEAWKSIRRIECALDEWEDALPEHLAEAEQDPAAQENSSRPSGLWFYYLSMKLMLNRLAFRVGTLSKRRLLPTLTLLRQRYETRHKLNQDQGNIDLQRCTSPLLPW